jgi:hypothetical protein
MDNDTPLFNNPHDTFEDIIDFSETQPQPEPQPQPQPQPVSQRQTRSSSTRKRKLAQASNKNAKSSMKPQYTQHLPGFSFTTQPNTFKVDTSHFSGEPQVPLKHFTSQGKDKIRLYTTGNVETDPVSGISSPVIRADPPGPAPIVNYDVFTEPYRDTTPSYARLQPFASREQSTPFPKPDPPRRRATSFGGVKKKSRKRTAKNSKSARKNKSRIMRKKSRRAGTTGKKHPAATPATPTVSVVGHLDTGIAADGSDNPDSPHRLFVPIVRDQSSDSGAKPITRIASEPDFLPTDKDTQLAHIRSRGATPVVDDPYLFERHGFTDEQLQDFANRYGSRKPKPERK